uniref:PGR5-like protein 1A, chloroplastic n=1 Tax=Oryza nivara TaxID=4536 RepID=A0A0E0IEU0_ORYNI
MWEPPLLMRHPPGIIAWLPRHPNIQELAVEGRHVLMASAPSEAEPCRRLLAGGPPNPLHLLTNQPPPTTCPDEQRLLEASMAYVAGNPIMTDAEFDELKLRLRKEGSEIVQEGPRCSLRSRKVYSDLTVDYFKMFLLNVPAAVVALTLFFFLDDLTGFEITYLLELPEPFSFIFTWFAALPLIFWVAQAITSAIVKDFLILKGPCPNCGNENLSFFGTILSVPSGGARNSVKCANCSSSLVYDSASRLITLPETAEA